jgi:hypothetical protein
MSDDNVEVPDTSSEFPPPAHFVLTPVKDGAYHKGLPTVTAVYLNLDKWPDGKFLMGTTGVTIDPHESDLGKLMLHLFIQPDEEEVETNDEGMQVFTDTCGFELTADAKVVEEFLDNIRKVKSFTFAVSTEEYYFSCRVDSESTMVTDVRCDWRYLN